MDFVDVFSGSPGGTSPNSRCGVKHSLGLAAMFLNDSRLRFLLRPEHYYCSSHHQLEIDRLFQPAWHFACAQSELARDGDFLTFELLGTPIILRNFEGTVHAFENICPHRHALLTSQPCGNSPKLRCQYHGWEFNEAGRTGKIPEARVFRPWDRDHSCLTKVKLDRCGDLLFVSLASDVQPLKEWLAPYYAEMEASFSAPDWQMRHVSQYDCQCNWKVPVENFLESYHVTALHPKWFRSLPSEENVTHTLNNRFTSLDYDAGSRVESLQARLRQFLGGTPTHQYRHRHLHPSTVFCTTDSIGYVMMFLPTSPTTVRIRMRMFAFRGTRRGPHAAILFQIAWQLGKRRSLKIQWEDNSIFADQQRGLQASRHPGVIGAREERVHQFQRYLLDSLDLPDPDGFIGDSSRPFHQRVR